MKQENPQKCSFSAQDRIGCFEQAAIFLQKRAAPAERGKYRIVDSFLQKTAVFVVESA